MTMIRHDFDNAHAHTCPFLYAPSDFAAADCHRSLIVYVKTCPVATLAGTSLFADL